MTPAGRCARLARPIPLSVAGARWLGQSRHIVGRAARARPLGACGTRGYHPAARMLSIIAATSSISRRSSSSASSVAASAASAARRCSRAALSRIARRIASDLLSPVASSWVSARRASSSRRTLMAEDTLNSVSQFVIRRCRSLAPAALRSLWHVFGTASHQRQVLGVAATVQPHSELGLRVGAGEGNRTLMTSLEGWGSAIELRPRGGRTRHSRAETTRG